MPRKFASLLLSPKGRISRADFWSGGALALGFQFAVINAAEVVGHILALVFIWCWICVYAKRLHDLGLSGWVQLPAHVFSVSQLITAMYPLAYGPDEIDNIENIGPIAWLVVSGVLISLAYVLWLGFAKGQTAENRYGAPTAKVAQA